MHLVPFERNELIKLRERAEGLVELDCMVQTWKRAYLALADAADHLDAMLARCTGPGLFPSPNDTGQPGRVKDPAITPGTLPPSVAFDGSSGFTS